ncbi:MAG TPA: Arc family DNA-binding protein [Planctomycetota bacterium]
MAQIIVRKIEKKVVDRLKQRARSNGRSLEAEVRTILSETASKPQIDWEAARKRVEAMHEMLKGRDLPPSIDLIREERE